jgi:hypothetical protein
MAGRQLAGIARSAGAHIGYFYHNGQWFFGNLILMASPAYQ